MSGIWTCIVMICLIIGGFKCMDYACESGISVGKSIILIIASIACIVLMITMGV